MLNSTLCLEGPVLILDDFEDHLLLLAELFRQRNIEAYTCLTPESAIATYLDLVKADNRPKLAILDAAVSDHRTGFDVARSIWECDSNRKTCLVILTAYAQKDIEDDLMALVSGTDAIINKDDVLQKPVDPDVLLEKLAIIQAGNRNTVGPKLLGVVSPTPEIKETDMIKNEPEATPEPPAKKPARNTDDYLKAIALFVLAGLAAWSISNRIADARWQGRMEAQQDETNRRLHTMHDDVDLSWAYIHDLQKIMLQSGLNPPPMPPRPNYDEPKGKN